MSSETGARTGVPTSRFARAVADRRRASGPVDDLQAGWIEFASSVPWTVLGHLTFRHAVTLVAADRIFRRRINMLSQQILGSGQYSRGHRIRWFRVAESQTDGRPHYHVLVHTSLSFPFAGAEALWRRLAGIGQVQEFVSGLGGIRYILKSVHIDGTGIVDFDGDWAVQPPDDMSVNRAPETDSQ